MIFQLNQIKAKTSTDIFSSRISKNSIDKVKNTKFRLKLIMKKVKCKAVIITQSGQGLCGCVDSPDNYFEIRPKVKNIDVR